MSVLEMKFLSSGHDYDSNDMTYLKTAVSNAVRIYMKDSGCSEICFQVSKNWNPQNQVQNVENGKEAERHKKYEAVSPDDRYTFDRLVLPEKTKENDYGKHRIYCPCRPAENEQRTSQNHLVVFDYLRNLSVGGYVGGLQRY